MVISLQKLNNEIQQDIVVYINGQNNNISEEEIEKIKKLITIYEKYDISIQLEKYNDTYIKEIIKILNELSGKFLISFEPSKDDNPMLFSMLTSQIKRCLNIVIKSEENYIKFTQKLNNKFNFTVDINILLNHFEEIKQNPYIHKMIISVDNIQDLREQEIEKIKELNILGIKFNWENIKGEHIRQLVTIDEYSKIYSTLRKYKKIADLGRTQLEKFLIAYYLIGKNVNYEFDEDGESSRNINAHSIKGAIIKKSAVCEGYAEALSQLLNILGIKNKCVTGKNIGKSKDSKHVWNQVQINGVWYNCDITNDSANIHDNRKFDFCLVSDKDYFLYQATSNNAEKCLETFNFDEIENER